jgi:hypothetical protein
VAKKKAGLGSIAQVAGGVLSRLPFLPKRPTSTPEPFSAIEDETPFGDVLSSPNVAPGMAKGAQAEGRPDLRAILESILRNKPTLIGIIAALSFLLILAVTAIVVTIPPKAPEASAPLTQKGEAVVKTWLPPPGDPLEPRMPMEREDAPAYTAEDAVKIGIDIDPIKLAELRDKNDKTIEDLYRTVR